MGREGQETSRFFNLVKRAKPTIGKSAGCLHPHAPDACGEKLVNAHTVQRRGTLARIAEDGHVLSTNISAHQTFKRFTDPDGSLFEPERVGVGRASTFRGYCDRHDSKLFEPIEQPDARLDASAVSLLGLRAVGFELVRKLGVLRSMPQHRCGDAGTPWDYQVAFQKWVNGFELGTVLAINDLVRWKTGYEDAVFGGNRSGLRYYCMVFDEVLPIAGSSVFQPEVDVRGRQIQEFQVGHPTEHVALSVVTFAGSSVAVFSWHDSPKHVGDKFIESLRDVPASAKGDVLTKLCVQYSENIFMRPSWWANLPEPSRKRLKLRIASGLETLAGPRVPFANDDHPCLSIRPVDELVWTPPV